jgi:hypothetical protein
MSTTAGSTLGGNLDPYTGAYYADQRQKISDSYQIGLADNEQKKQQADLSWQDRIAQLDQKLGLENNQFGDKFAQRGLLNSGIYNYGSQSGQNADLARGQGGALQQFQWNTAEQNQAANAQQQNVDDQYATQQKELGGTYTNESNSLNNMETAAGGTQTTDNSINNILNGSSLPNGVNGLPTASSVQQSISSTLNGATG